MINANEVSRSYGECLAVDRVSFAIGAGEIVGLLGHNGAGKTTIMKMLSGYLEPSTGSVEIENILLAEQPVAVQRLLGYLPERLPVYPDMSVADYLDYAATLKGLQGDELRQAVRRAIRDTELQGKLLDPINTLSRGYQQRVGVAQAILGSPRVLILDEPTNGLDPGQTRHMRELICSIAERATIILSTHIMQEVDAICSRALILNNGRLALNEKLDDLRSTRSLLLRSSLDPDQVSGLSASLPELAATSPVEAEPGLYRLELAPTMDDPDRAAAAVASAVLASGGELFQLRAEVRDLETVFREVNAPGGAAHVA